MHLYSCSHDNVAVERGAKLLNYASFDSGQSLYTPVNLSEKFVDISLVKSIALLD